MCKACVRGVCKSHHLGHSSNGLRGSMNIGQHENGRTSSSQKSRSVRAVRTWRRAWMAAGREGFFWGGRG